jgi:hypothetical protein
MRRFLLLLLDLSELGLAFCARKSQFRNPE